MRGIAIYIEGGGDSPDQKAELRRGFDLLIGRLKAKAGEKRLGWKVVFSGSRQATYEAFINAVRNEPDTINALLVDSEEQIASATGNAAQDAMARVAHLTRRDAWNLSAVQPDRIHLMVQCMEAWIVADVDALARFYGQHFSRNALPARPNLEEESKKDLHDKLVHATRATQKGQYHKIRHASRLLPLLDSAIVAKRCPHFAVLTGWLEETITSL